MKLKLHAEHFLDRLSRGGVLLTTKADEKINTMTIGWGSISQYWGKDVMIVPVRHSRYTHELLEASDNFTVSVPKFNEMAKEIGYCGTNSGRDVDKFEKCGFRTVPSKSVDAPIIGQAHLHYECKIIARVELNAENIDKELTSNWYATNDFHTLYFGEIIECYTTN